MIHPGVPRQAGAKEHPGRVQAHVQVRQDDASRFVRLVRQDPACVDWQDQAPLRRGRQRTRGKSNPTRASQSHIHGQKLPMLSAKTYAYGAFVRDFAFVSHEWVWSVVKLHLHLSTAFWFRSVVRFAYYSASSGHFPYATTSFAYHSASSGHFPYATTSFAYHSARSGHVAYATTSFAYHSARSGHVATTHTATAPQPVRQDGILPSQPQRVPRQRLRLVLKKPSVVAVGTASASVAPSKLTLVKPAAALPPKTLVCNTYPCMSAYDR